MPTPTHYGAVTKTAAPNWATFQRQMERPPLTFVSANWDDPGSKTTQSQGDCQICAAKSRLCCNRFEPESAVQAQWRWWVGHKAGQGERHLFDGQ